MSEKTQYVARNAMDSFMYALNAKKTEVTARNPCLIVKPNVPKNPQYSGVDIVLMHFIRGENKTSFDVTVKPTYLYAALERMKEYAEIPYESDETPNTAWTLRGPKMVNGKMTGETQDRGTLVVGRNKTGVYITLVSWNKNMPRFPFYPGLCDDRSVRINEEDAKNAYNQITGAAKGWASAIGATLPVELSTQINRALDKLRAQQGGGNGGGNSGGGYGGGDNYDNTSSGEESQNNDDFVF